MSDENDDDDDDADGPPTRSRLGWRGPQPPRRLKRYSGRHFKRLFKQHQVAELIGKVIQLRGLTDEARQRFVCLHWTELAGDHIASKTFPTSFERGVLQVSAINSAWVQEMQFSKAKLISQINDGIAANRVWLGPPPLVSDVRFVLGARVRETLVDREHAEQLRLSHKRRTRPRVDVLPPTASDQDRDAIRADTCGIQDADLRATIEHVRMKWNR